MKNNSSTHRQRPGRSPVTPITKRRREAGKQAIRTEVVDDGVVIKPKRNGANLQDVAGRLKNATIRGEHKLHVTSLPGGEMKVQAPVPPAELVMVVHHQTGFCA